MKMPRRRAEWQEAADAAELMLLIDSATQYGLIEGGPDVNQERCSQILIEAARIGVLPAPHGELIARAFKRNEAPN